MKIITILFFTFFVTAVQAGVNLKNGNHYISFTDLIVPGDGHDLEIIRTCNSKSIEKGWYGACWGSDFETYLTMSADGSAVIHENGSGALTRFTPKGPINAKAAAEKIVTAMRKKATLDPKFAANLIKKLTNDADYRREYAKRFKVKSKLPKGAVLYSNTRGLQELHKVAEGYERKYNDGKVEFFDTNGRLSKISDKHGYKVKLTYNKAGRLEHIKDSRAKQIFFDWWDNGRIKSLWSGADKKKAYYKYDGDNLIESIDVNGNKFVYTYDTYHNMTKIVYSDGTSMKIDYEPKTQFVSKITNRVGHETKYKYESNPKNPTFHYWTLVTKKRGKEVGPTNRYEYEIKTRPDGSQYTYRIYTIVNNLKTETIYTECCTLPLVIKRGKNVTNFEYNKKGLLTKKTSTTGEYVELEYHKKFNKITKVVNKIGWTRFDYDPRGNLIKALNKQGKGVRLFYDYKGRITKMVDNDKKEKKQRVLSFKYNILGKPVEIAMEKVGTINVAYDNYGEILKVDSKAGHKMALQVTSAFQSLLTIVKPAGVNLNL